MWEKYPYLQLECTQIYTKNQEKTEFAQQNF